MPMWLTEEYAIKALTSVCRKQEKLIYREPIRATETINKKIIQLKAKLIIGKIRKIP